MTKIFYSVVFVALITSTAFELRGDEKKLTLSGNEDKNLKEKADKFLEATDVHAKLEKLEADKEQKPQRIRITGFMRPAFRQEGITAFVLTKSNQEMNFGVLQPSEYVVVKLRKGEAMKFTTKRIYIEGTLSLKRLTEHKLPTLIDCEQVKVRKNNKNGDKSDK